MILAAEHVRLIRAGKKTEHRIPVIEPKPRGPGEHPGFGNQPHVGQVVPLSVRQRIDGKLCAVPQCTIIVTDYQHALLGNSLDDRGVAARAEGHRTTDDYKTWWMREHDRPWINAYVIRHELEPDDGVLLERFDRRHANAAVWVITCQPDRVAPDRFIARDGRGDEHGYTTRPEMAVRNIPPAVDEITQRRISDQGREMDALRAAGVAERDLDRLRALDVEITHWRTAGPGVRDHVRQLQRGRAGLERQLREQVRNRQAAA